MQVTLANWRNSPFNRWAFHHVRELIPSANIAHDPAKIRPLAGRPADLPPELENKLSSQAMPMDAARIGFTMRAISEVRKLLA